MRRAVAIVGVGADGCAGLSARAVNAVATADVLAGGARHLAFFPQFAGERIVLGKDLAAEVERIAAAADERAVCVLASGDPLFFGIGARLVERVGAEHVDVVPHPSAVQWAFARAGIAWDDAALLSVHGRSLAGVAARVRRSRKAAVLTGGPSGPAALARHLAEHGERGLAAWLCEDLGGARERVRRFASLEELAAAGEAAPLNVVLLVRDDPGWRPPPALPHLAEEALEMRRPKAGLVTKREVRAVALATLALRPDAVVWDVGAGSGSVAIEAASLALDGRVYAIERDPTSAAHCRANARAHGMDHVVVVEGAAPAALEGLEAPDAVFVGGSGGALAAIAATALARLRPGGRLVVAAVTFETLEAARRALSEGGAEPEVTLLSVSRGTAIGALQRLDPLTPVFLVAATRPGELR
ncbi:MAG: precorrin-6y C5,15-methyltransferase (decarboxylating) subunit CbiE [Anaeromyxobacteraceae bacterium]